MIRTVVITGATSGLGLCMAAEFLERGARVAMCGRSRESVERALKQLVIYEGRVHGFVRDVRRADEMDALWNEALACLGRIDIWINNAGIAAPRETLAETEQNALALTVGTNLPGLMYGSRAAWRGMRESGGWIFNRTCWTGADKSSGVRSVREATDRAAISFCRALAREAGQGPVKIGMLRTERFRNVNQETIARSLVRGMLAARRTGVAIGPPPALFLGSWR